MTIDWRRHARSWLDPFGRFAPLPADGRLGLFLIVIVALLADPAYEQVFSHLNTPDDEGYVTLTLRSFVDGNALYDDVYSQYGPGFYAFVGGAMDLLGSPSTTTEPGG